MQEVTPELPENVAYILVMTEKDEMLIGAEMARRTVPNEFIVTKDNGAEIVSVGGSESLADALATIFGSLTGEKYEVRFYKQD